MDKQIKLLHKIAKQTKVIHTYSGYSFNIDTKKVHSNDKDKLEKDKKYKYYTYN
jgi:hypothetical protein